MNDTNNGLKPRIFDVSSEKRIISFYPSVNKKGDIVTVGTSDERKAVSYKDLRKAYFAGK